MPVRQFVLLLTLFAACLLIVGLAWACGSELYMFLPGGRFHGIRKPPTHPGGVLASLLFAVPLTLLTRQYGIYYFIVATASVFLGSLHGFFFFGWTPSPLQHVLSVAMVVTCVYAWQQKVYFEE